MLRAPERGSTLTRIKCDTRRGARMGLFYPHARTLLGIGTVTRPDLVSGSSRVHSDVDGPDALRGGSGACDIYTILH